MRGYRVWLLVAARRRGCGVRSPLGRRAPASSRPSSSSVASRLDARTGVLTIEASAPVPYVASQPDPRSFVIELRDVVTTGAVSDRFMADPRSPFTAVAVENAVAADGARVARVNVALSQPGAAAGAELAQPHHRRGRSARPRAPSAGDISAAGRSTVIQDVRVAARSAARRR